MLVKDVMTSHVVTVKEDATVTEAAKLMQRYDIGVIPVVNGTTVSGMVTDRDIVLRCVAGGKSPAECRIGDLMTESAACVAPNQSLEDCIHVMSQEQVRRLPVLENGRLEGIVSLADIARVRTSAEIAEALAEICMP
ncbi:MAG TPA: CBS domain-containing protein [Firmicutes bacterium]|nr:CBS domain-containing protein [Bacillota bacterium]